MRKGNVFLCLVQEIQSFGFSFIEEGIENLILILILIFPLRPNSITATNMVLFRVSAGGEG